MLNIAMILSPSLLCYAWPRLPRAQALSALCLCTHNKLGRSMLGKILFLLNQPRGWWAFPSNTALLGF